MISQIGVTRDSRRWLEITAVLITGLCKFLFVDLLPFKFWYILVTCSFWITYVLIRHRQQKSILKYWGFTSTWFGKAFIRLLPFVLACVIIFLITGWLRGSLILSWHILPVLLLYPIWGVIQQFLIIALIAGNLSELQRLRPSRLLITFLTAMVFSIVHYPSLHLIAGTFVLALVYVDVYLKYKNLWVLGIYHGWLGAFFYFFVLDRDAWLEIVKTL